MLKILSTAAAWTYNRDFNPEFYIEHFVKDMKIVIDECDRMKLENLEPGLSKARRLYESLIKNGAKKLGT